MKKIYLSGPEPCPVLLLKLYQLNRHRSKSLWVLFLYPF